MQKQSPKYFGNCAFVVDKNRPPVDVEDEEEDDENARFEGEGSAGSDSESDSESDMDDDDDDDELWGTTPPEMAVLHLASNVAERERKKHPKMVKWESTMRQDMMVDCVERVRKGLAEKNIALVRDVRNMASQRRVTRAWALVNGHGRRAHRARGTYERCLAALAHLDPALAAKHRHITAQDMKLSQDITEEKRVGQKAYTLPWIWTRGTGVAEKDGSLPAMEEDANADVIECAFLQGRRNGV